MEGGPNTSISGLGSFEVFLNDKLIHSKLQTGRSPGVEEIVELINKTIDT